MVWQTDFGTVQNRMNDFQFPQFNPFRFEWGSVYYSTRGQFQLENPYSHYGFQTDGYFGWGVSGGPSFRDDVESMLSFFEIDTSTRKSKIFITDPINFFSYGWFLEEDGAVGAHMLYGGSRIIPPNRNPYGRGVDACFNHDYERRDEPTYFPPPNLAFFEDANSFIYTGDESGPRVTCPALVRSDWWDRLRFFIRVFDTVYVLKPTEYARQCYYRLIEDELPAILSLFLRKEYYEKIPLRDALAELNLVGWFNSVHFNITGRVFFAYKAPSFAQPSEIRDAFAPYPVTALLSPTPPFVREVPSLLQTAVGKPMTYSPYTPGPCMFPGPRYDGSYTSIDGWGIVPVIEEMTEREFREWRDGVRRNGGGFTLFSVAPRNHPFIGTGSFLLIWGGTCGDYILFDLPEAEEVVETHTSTKILREGWFRTSGGVKFYSVYGVTATATLSVLFARDLLNLYAYMPPKAETVAKLVYPYFTVERVHVLLDEPKRKLLLKPRGFHFFVVKRPDFSRLKTLINDEAEEYVSVDFGTTYPEMASSFPGPQWLCSNVNVWHLGGTALPVEWYSDKISAYSVSRKMSNPKANREFFVELLAPVMNEAFTKVWGRWAYLVGGGNLPIGPEKVLLTGWKGFDIKGRSPKEMVWTMTTSGEKITLEQKATQIGFFKVFRRIPAVIQPDETLNAIASFLAKLPHYSDILAGGDFLRGVEPKWKAPSLSFMTGIDERPLPTASFMSTFVEPLPERLLVGVDLRRKLQEVGGFEICGLGAFVPIPLSMLQRDPNEDDPTNGEKCPHRILFVGSCVDPPELQSIAGWYCWGVSLPIYRENLDDVWALISELREWVGDDSLKYEALHRAVYRVNAVRWRMKRFVDNWDDFAELAHVFDFTHLPIVETARILVESDFDSLGNRFIKLVRYYQPLIISDVKPFAYHESVAVAEGAVARSTPEETIISHDFLRATYPNILLHPYADPSIIGVASEIERQIGSIENVEDKVVFSGHHNVGLPFYLMYPTESAWKLQETLSASRSRRVGYQSFQYWDEQGFGDITTLPRHRLRELNLPLTLHSRDVWFPNQHDLLVLQEKNLLEISSLLPAKTKRHLHPSVEFSNQLLLSSPAPLFYFEVGRRGWGRSGRRFHEGKIGPTVVGEDIYVVTKAGKHSFGYNEFGGQARSIHLRSGDYYTRSTEFLLQVRQQLDNLRRLFGSDVWLKHDGSLVWKQYTPVWRLGEAELLHMHPALNWLGGLTLVTPIFLYKAMGGSGGRQNAEFSFDRGKDERVEWTLRELSPASVVRVYEVGNKASLPLVALLGLPPLPTDFLPLRMTADRDYGKDYWLPQVNNKGFLYPTHLFTFVVPPLGWLGCIGVPGVSPTGISPMFSDVRDRFYLSDTEYNYGDKYVPLDAVEKVLRLRDRHGASRYEYYMEVPHVTDSEAIKELYSLYEEDFEVIEDGEQKFYRLVLCRSGELRARFYWNFKSYLKYSRLSIFKENNTILAPEKVLLGSKVEENRITHRWAEGRRRFYLLPLFPVNHWGMPVSFQWGDKLFHADWLPNEYGSVLFSMSIAYPIPFGSIKRTLVEYIDAKEKEISEDKEKIYTYKVSEWKSSLKEMLLRYRWHEWTTFYDTEKKTEKEFTLKELIEMIPDGLIVGQPWYAPFAAYYVPQHAIQPISLPKPHQGKVAYTFTYPLSGRLPRRVLLENWASTVYPNLVASRRPFYHSPQLRWEDIMSGESKRYPVCITAQISPFVTGGVHYDDNRNLLLWWSFADIPLPIFKPATPEKLMHPDNWCDLLLSKTPNAEVYGLFENFMITAHCNRIVPLESFQNGLLVNTFTPPFLPHPLQSYPFTLPTFWLQIDRQFRYDLPYYTLSLPTKPNSAREGFCCDGNSLLLCDYSSVSIRTLNLRDTTKLLPMHEPHEIQILLPDFAQPDLTIGSSLLGGYTYLHKVVNPPIPVIYHSSFNMCYAEHRANPKEFRTFVLTDERPLEKIFEHLVTPDVLFIRSYIAGQVLAGSTPTAPSSHFIQPLYEEEPTQAVSTLPPLRWGVFFPPRFYYHLVSWRSLEEADIWPQNHPKRDMEGSPYKHLINKLINSPFVLSFDMRLLPTGAENLRQLLSQVVVGVASHERGVALEMLKRQNSPYIWFHQMPKDHNLFEADGDFSSLLKLGYMPRLFYPYHHNALSSIHRSLDNPHLLTRLYGAFPIVPERQYKRTDVGMLLDKIPPEALTLVTVPLLTTSYGENVAQGRLPLMDEIETPTFSDMVFSRLAARIDFQYPLHDIYASTKSVVGVSRWLELVEQEGITDEERLKILWETPLAAFVTAVLSANPDTEAEVVDE